MCELLGIAASEPADVVFSFTGLALRGGQTGPHADGWGLSLYQDRFARTFLEQDPAHASELARFLREHPIPTRLAIAHVRKMTRGTASLVNTHPFVRVMDGRHVVFAHNGTLPRVKERKLRVESTLGTTDSEYAFCVILEALREAFGHRYPDDPLELGKFLFELGNELGREGMFNFLLADGDHLFARCGDSLCSIVRKAPFGPATLVDAEVRVHYGDILGEHAGASTAVVATAPLTRDEAWVRAEPGSLLVLGRGDLLHTFAPPSDYQPGSSVAPAWEPA
ncbi:MAG: class II glutamine amidotransferase [Polyangiales bacterium]